MFTELEGINSRPEIFQYYTPENFAGQTTGKTAINNLSIIIFKE
jgi:hypothetical protein